MRFSALLVARLLLGIAERVQLEQDFSISRGPDPDAAEIALTDVTGLIEDLDTAGKVRCCCDDRISKIKSEGSWKNKVMRAISKKQRFSGRCEVHTSFSKKIDPRGSPKKCRTLGGAPWLLGMRSRHFRNTGGRCMVAQEEVPYLFGRLNSVGADYCKAVPGMVPFAHLSARVDVTCPHGFKPDAEHAYCSFDSLEEGKYVPAPNCRHTGNYCHGSIAEEASGPIIFGGGLGEKVEVHCSPGFWPVFAKVNCAPNHRFIPAPACTNETRREEEPVVSGVQRKIQLVPEKAEYEDFLRVDDVNVEMHKIADIGKKVAAHIDNEEWKMQLQRGSYRATAFLHRTSSKLRKKMASSIYQGKPLAGAKIAVVGGGPAGLRFAVEARLLGAEVHVLEKRTKYNRYNVLKLWPYSVYDLTSVGVKDLFPGLTMYKVKRIPIAILQHSLARIALALGVQLHVGCWSQKLQRNGGWPGPSLNSDCKSRMELQSLKFNAIYDATGNGAAMRDSEFEADEGLLQVREDGKASIGMTINFKRFSKDNAFWERAKSDPRFAKYNPAKEDSSGLSYQYAQNMFHSKRVLLENWVYWKGAISHYIVLTIPLQSLVSFGVVPNISVRDALHHVNKSRLAELGLDIAEDWNFPVAHANVSAYVDPDDRGIPDIAVFEYGRAKTAKNPAIFLSGEGQDSVLFAVLGDALKTPFWPFGTGANRALYSVQMQAMTAVAWWHYKLPESEVLTLSKEMSIRLLSVPITGNGVGFDNAEYEKQVSGYWQSTANNKLPDFY